MELVMIVVPDVPAKQTCLSVVVEAAQRTARKFLVFLVEVTVLVIAQDVLVAIVAVGAIVQMHVVNHVLNNAPKIVMVYVLKDVKVAALVKQ
jgi:hypothetical protein